MDVLTTRDALRTFIRETRASGRTIGLVPTMGYLHRGHTTLMERARAECDIVVATIFVNPTQFAAGEDLDTYPRDPEGDRRKCEAAGVDLLWMPPAGEVYRDGHATTVSVAGLSTHLCGRTRPSHFAGVATVVLKLLLLAAPHRAYFGEKDWQQLQVIRALVADLDVDTEVVGVPTVREADGLALSSRNAYLDAGERQRALVLSRALRAAIEAWRGGERNSDSLREVLRRHVGDAADVSVDYAEVVGPSRVEPIEGRIGEDSGAVAALAVRVGRTRLIDNARLDRPDAGLIAATDAWWTARAAGADRP